VREGLSELVTVFGGGAAVKFAPDDGAPGNDTDDNGGLTTDSELNKEETV
jgi:hypothetical protein